MLKKTLFPLIGMLWITQTFAQDERWFEVEVYLFERDASHSQERSPEQLTLTDTTKAVDLISPLFSTDITGASLGLEGCSSSDWATNADQCNAQLESTQVNHVSQIPVNIVAATEQYGVPGGPPVLLSKEQNQFSEIMSKISREPGNKSLLHMSWQQSMLPRHKAKPVRLFSGQDYSDRFEINGQTIQSFQSDLTIPQFDFLDTGFSAKTDKPVWELDGTVNIYLDHFLYVETALNLREEGTKNLDISSSSLNETLEKNNKITPFLYAFPLTQNRRVRSDEIHYFDHPKMGMILQIRKMEQPKNKLNEMTANEF
ncbi:peptidoglycan binding protein CsiV [Shewanella sp. D64]|uniref:peptidoglycan binding protein CsiV n=1 Tax=unclassified Shewanella TaxID=196818 RepID=UPI0022BA1347|nr:MULTISPECIES: peptidoglycan binding protein CsiV [unclassified Shewanella]MEC4725685.1 peptidoglycan binding protein CsiV [Shewanella sp. D64]MEC4737708.1 peptidoglycan binding protein CsiV [Shewanella sp. E94]WBJ93514.1 peptidoglycan binding protein CsiV [Shewanella sp. MTB7]